MPSGKHRGFTTRRGGGTGRIDLYNFLGEVDVVEAETYQRALHLWPEWNESILSSRRALCYEPTWQVVEAVAWIEENYKEEIEPRARAELVRLALPANLQTYWEDCFYCDYLRADGIVDFNKIRRRIAYEELDGLAKKTGQWLEGNRSMPALPFSAGLVWYEDEDIHGPWLRIEVQVHAHLVSRDLLDSAMDQAWRTITDSRNFPLGEAAVENHPLTALIPQAKANRSETKRRALERWQLGEVDLDGLLAEECQDPRVQRELWAMVAEYRGNPVQLQKMHRALQKRVYDRVLKWFPDPKPWIAVKGQWRRHLPLPDSNEPEPPTGGEDSPQP